MSSSVQTRKASPAARPPSEATANAAVSSAPMRMPAFSNGASHEDVAGSEAASARMRVPSAPAPAVCHERRRSPVALAERAPELPAKHVVDFALVALRLDGVDHEELHPAVGNHEGGGRNLCADFGEEALERAGKRGPREWRPVRTGREGLGRQRAGHDAEGGRRREGGASRSVGGTDVDEPVARQDERVRRTGGPPERRRERVLPAVTQRRSPC